MTRLQRITFGLLAAYAASMTLLAAWLGGRSWVYWRVLTVGMGMKSASPTHEQVLANVGAPRVLTGATDQVALGLAGLDPANLAALIFVIVLSGLGFASRRGKESKNPDLKKD